MTQPRILLIEDEPGLVLTLTDRLQSEGYQVDSASDGETGFQLACDRRHHLILLDLMLPGRSGLDICRDLRAEHVNTPILMLTARDLVTDKIVGLKLGADDYMTKPFEMLELLARVEALLRRVPAAAADDIVRYEFGDVVVDMPRGQVTLRGAEVDLSVREFALLRFFVRNRGRVLSRDELLKGVWGYDNAPFTRTVDVHVAALRSKLGDAGLGGHEEYLITVHGRGYRFCG